MIGLMAPDHSVGTAWQGSFSCRAQPKGVRLGEPAVRRYGAGLIEGIADGAAGLARFAGGTLADGISSLGLHPALYASKRSPAWWRMNASAIWLLAEV